MRIRDFFIQQSGWGQALLLVFLFCGGAVVASIIALVSQGLSGKALVDIDLARWAQTVSSVGMFLAPALAMAWLCDRRPGRYLSLRGVADGRVWALVVVNMLLVAAPISLLGALNQEMSLPAFLEPVERWMRAQEDLAQELTVAMIGDGSAGQIAINLLVMALCPAITEEFFFRGALRRVVERFGAGPRASVWIVAVLFSAIHLQFYGFVPRMLLGAYFGYLLLWTRSIWVPVCAHFVNNATAVIALSDPALKDNAMVSGEIPDGAYVAFLIPALFATVLFFFFNKKMRRYLEKG